MAKSTHDMSLSIGIKNLDLQKDVTKTVSILGGLNNSIKTIDSKLTLQNARAFISSVRSITTSVLSLTKKSVNYIENLNLMNVSFGKTSESAKDFVDSLSGVYGLDENTLTRQVSLFKQLGNSLGMASEYSDLLAKNLVKMQLDISSLYDIDFTDAGTKLFSGLTGQPRSLKTLGVDITQKTLQTDLDRLGINKTVTNLNKAEQAILTYLSLERQFATSNGDLARTINSPANQLRIFTEQCSRLARAVGNVLLPMLAKVLPFLNGILMVATELVSMFATLVGYNEEDFNFGTSAVTDSWDDWLDSISGTNSALDDTKKKLTSLRGFDKLNVINTPTSSSSGVNGIGKIDSKLLDAIKQYGVSLDGIQNKATKIRDSIMEWLGFTKEINPETGEISWKLSEGYSNLKLIGGILGGLILVKIIGIVAKISEGVGLVGKLFKNSAMIKGFNTIAKALGLTSASLTAIIGVLVATEVAVGNNYTSSKKYAEALWNLKNRTDLTKEEIEEFGAALEKNNKSMNTTSTIANILAGPLGFIGTTISNITGKLNGAKDAQEKFNASIADSVFFSGGGLTVSGYADVVKQYIQTVVDGLPALEEFDNTIDASKTSFNEASAGAELLIGKMSTDIFKATAEDIATLNTHLNTMIDASNSESDAFANATISIVQNLKNQGYVAEETAAIVVESALEKAKAEKDANETIRLEIQKLDKDLDKNKITQKEYAEKVQEVYNKYLDVNKEIDVTKTKLKALGTDIVINGQNWSTVNETITDLKDTFDSSTKSIKDNTKSANDYLYETMSKYEEGSKEYQALTDTITANNKKQTDSVKDIEKTYATSLYNILTNLSSSGELMTKSGRDTADKIIKQFNDMGYEIDTTESMKEILKQIESINPEIKITADASGVTTSLQKSIDKVLNLNKKVFTILGIPTKADGGFLNTGEMFIAREAGPELVGTIGNKTAVANNDQIVESISIGVYKAMKNSNFGNSNVNIQVSEKGGILDYLDIKKTQKDRQYGL